MPVPRRASCGAATSSSAFRARSGERGRGLPELPQCLRSINPRGWSLREKEIRRGEKRKRGGISPVCPSTAFSATYSRQHLNMRVKGEEKREKEKGERREKKGRREKKRRKARRGPCENFPGAARPDPPHFYLAPKIITLNVGPGSTIIMRGQLPPTLTYENPVVDRCVLRGGARVGQDSKMNTNMMPLGRVLVVMMSRVGRAKMAAWAARSSSSRRKGRTRGA